MLPVVRTRRGQALIESVLVIPLLLIIFTAIFWFSRVVLTRQQLLTAARYGTDMIAYTDMNEDQIRREIRTYLCDPGTEGRTLDSSQLPDKNIRIVIDRYMLPEMGFYNLSGYAKLARMLDEIAVPLKHTSSVEIYYSIPLPRMFSLWGEYLPGAEAPRSITLSARSEVLAGTGCHNQHHRSARR
jgi:hypothetical protein